jgi:hypothetical protein
MCVYLVICSVLNLWEYGKNHLISGWLIITHPKRLALQTHIFTTWLAAMGAALQATKRCRDLTMRVC